MRSFSKLAGICAAVALLFCGSQNSVHADLVFKFEQAANVVTMTSSGSIDTAGLNPTAFNNWVGVGFEDNLETHAIGGTTSPAQLNTSFSFNTGTDLSPWTTDNPWDSEFFDFVIASGVRPFATYTRVAGVRVPGLVIDSADLVGSIWTPDQNWTATGESIASLGLNPGIYTVTDAVSGESITFDISAIPEPSSLILLGVAGLGFFFRRSR